MLRPSKLLLPSQFYSFSCRLSLSLLLSLFLVAISLFSVPRVPQSSSAEGDTIPWVELANELTAAKNSHSSLSADGTLHEWYLSLPVVAEAVFVTTACTMWFERHWHPKSGIKCCLSTSQKLFFEGRAKVQPLTALDFSGEVYWGKTCIDVAFKSRLFNSNLTAWPHISLMMLA